MPLYLMIQVVINSLVLVMKESKRLAEKTGDAMFDNFVVLIGKNIQGLEELKVTIRDYENKQRGRTQSITAS